MPCPGAFVKSPNILSLKNNKMFEQKVSSFDQKRDL